MSLRFQADNDLRFAIVKAVRRLEPAIDFVSAPNKPLHHPPDAIEYLPSMVVVLEGEAIRPPD